MSCPRCNPQCAGPDPEFAPLCYRCLLAAESDFLPPNLPDNQPLPNNVVPLRRKAP